MRWERLVAAREIFEDWEDRGDLISVCKRAHEIDHAVMRTDGPIQSISSSTCAEKESRLEEIAVLPLQSEQELLAANAAKRTPPLLSPYLSKKRVAMSILQCLGTRI